MLAMAAESNEEEIRSTRRRPWAMKVEVKGVGGILVLGGAFIAAAFAAHRARIVRRRRTAASTSPQTQKGQKEERSRALLGSGGVADGGEQQGDGAAQCGAALADEREEQISLKAEDDVGKSEDAVSELTRANLMSHEDRTLGDSDRCFVIIEQQVAEIESEESYLLLDASKLSDFLKHVEEDPSPDSSMNEPCNRTQVMSDGLMTVQEIEQVTSATASHLTGIEEEPEEESPVTETFEQMEDLTDEEDFEMNGEGSEVSGIYASSSPSSESSADPIWPADLVNDASSHREISEEVKDMVHPEHSGEGRTEAESEEMKLKANAATVFSSGTSVVLRKNSKSLLLLRLLLILFAVATALGLISLLDKEQQLITGHLSDLCNKIFHTIFASGDNRYEF